MSDGSDGGESLLHSGSDVDRTPRDHDRQGLPSREEANRRAGPLPPPGAMQRDDDRYTPPVDAVTPQIAAPSTEAARPARPATAMPAAKAAAAQCSALTARTLDRPMTSNNPREESSLTWSETSLVLDGPSLQTAVDRLHTLYRQELQARCIPSRSQAGCLAGLRRRTNVCDWQRLQDEAMQRLTGERLREWQTFEFEATHERRPRRRPPPPADDSRSRSPRPHE